MGEGGEEAREESSCRKSVKHPPLRLFLKYATTWYALNFPLKSCAAADVGVSDPSAA